MTNRRPPLPRPGPFSVRRPPPPPVERRFRRLLVLCLALPVELAAAGVSADGIGRRIEQTRQTPAYADVRVAVVVQRVDTPAPLYTRQPDDPFPPASVVKAILSAVCLDVLGPDHRFRTRLLSDPRPDADGRLSGPIWLEGSGDPTLTTARLSALADRVGEAGIRVVRDGIRYDDSVFDTEAPRHGDNARHLYAPPGGLNLDGNRIDVRIVSEHPARLALVPPSRYATLTHDVTLSPSSRPGRPRMTVTPGESGDHFTISGQITHWDRRYDYLALGVTRPGLYCAAMLADRLEARGIAVPGPVERGRPPPTARVLAVDESPPLTEILSAMNQESVNVTAECLLKVLAVAAGERPGTRLGGARVVGSHLNRDWGLAKDSFRLVDGSGLSPLNSLSARQVVSLLRRFAASPGIGPALQETLSEQGRHPHAAYPVPPPHLSVRVKSGTLSARGVNTLAGYITDRGDGAVYAFAIFAARRAPGPLTFSGTLTNPLLAALLDAFPPPGVPGPAVVDPDGPRGNQLGRLSEAGQVD